MSCPPPAYNELHSEEITALIHCSKDKYDIFTNQVRVTYPADCKKYVKNVE